MTDLASFFAEYDVESLRAKVLESDGIDIQGVYCLSTGKQVGTFDESVILDAIDEIGSEDEDALIDDLIVRVIASMRPSPALNKPDAYTIRELSSKRPADVMAFLVNRLNGNRHLLSQRSSDDSFQPLYNRIATHRRWTELSEIPDFPMTRWIHLLLELDAKMNLHDMSSPLIDVDKQGNLILAQSGTPLFSMVTLANHEDLYNAFESWAFAKLNEFDQRDRRMILEANWARGNTMVRRAFSRSYLENPEIANRRHAENHKKKSKAGRPAKSPRTQKINAEVNQFLHLLEGLLDGSIETPVAPSKPKPRVMTGASLKFLNKGA